MNVSTTVADATLGHTDREIRCGDWILMRISVPEKENPSTLIVNGSLYFLSNAGLYLKA